MKNTTRRVFILKNVNSEIIEQAFLILRDSAPDGDSKVIHEAEKIVEKYMNNGTLTTANSVCPQGQSRKKILTFLCLGCVLSGLALTVFFLAR